MSSTPGRVKLKTIKLAFAASPLIGVKHQSLTHSESFMIIWLNGIATVSLVMKYSVFGR